MHRPANVLADPWPLISIFKQLRGGGSLEAGSGNSFGARAEAERRVRARASARGEQAGRQTRRRAPGRGGDSPRKDGGMGAGAAAVSLRVRPLGLSLAVGGDRGRRKGNGGWPQLLFRGRCSEPLPQWASDEGMSRMIQRPVRSRGRPAVILRMRARGPRSSEEVPWASEGRPQRGRARGGGREVRGCL